MALITDTTLQALNAELERKNVILQKFANKYAPTTWLDVQAKVRSGKAADNFVIGDELICNYLYAPTNTIYQFPWVVADIDREVEWEDGTKHPGLILLSKYVTKELLPMKKPCDILVDLTQESTAQSGWYYFGRTGTTGSNYTPLNLSTGDVIPTTYDSVHKSKWNNIDTLLYGRSRYKDSDIRQFLNSSAEPGQWWEPMYKEDTAPTNSTVYAGFMHGLDTDFLDVVSPIKVKTKADTDDGSWIVDETYDKFYLPSREEMYGDTESGLYDSDGVEGTYLPYIKAIMGVESPTSAPNDGRKFYELGTTTIRGYKLRTKSKKRKLSFDNATTSYGNGRIIDIWGQGGGSETNTSMTLLVECAIS